MKKMLPSILLAAVCSVALMATTTKAADAKSYQVTGPVLEVTPTTFTVQKGEEKWEIARDKGTKMNGEVKVGSKVTIYYRMVATEVEIKDAKPTPKTDTKKKKSQ
jgi:uncharacterized cupredoxin-like copper-binding protein